MTMKGVTGQMERDEVRKGKRKEIGRGGHSNSLPIATFHIIFAARFASPY